MCTCSALLTKNVDSITLSKHIWKILEEIGKSSVIKWNIVKKKKKKKKKHKLTKEVTIATNCLKEKLYILEYGNNKFMNKNELISKYSHVDKFLLCHLPPG